MRRFACSHVPVSPARPSGRRARAFSLIEVVAAVAVFAFAMVGILGLFSPIARSVVQSADAEAAARMAELLRMRLQTMPFDDVAALLKNSKENGHELIEADAKGDYDISQDAQLLFASRDGSKIGRYADNIWLNPQTRRNWDGEKFFEIALVRNEAITPKPSADAAGGESGKVTVDPALNLIAYTARVRWPAFVADTATTAVQPGLGASASVRFDHSRKQVLHFTGSITR